MTRSQNVLLYHTSVGTGEPLLLLNGIAMSVASWAPMVPSLAARYRVVRCDLRGQLMSPGEPPGDVTEHAADVVALLDALEIDRAHLVATSFGGVVAALVAAHWPQRVRSLESIASADGFDGSMAEEVERWRDGCLRSLEGGDRGVLSDVLEATVYSKEWLARHGEQRAERRRLIAALPDSFFEGLTGLLESAPSVRLERRELGAIHCPTLVVAAERDGFIPLERTRVLAERIPHARFMVVEGAGHAVVVEQPDELVKICLDFLAGISP